MIRQFREADREAVIAVWQASGLVRPQNDPSRDVDRKASYDPEGFLVAEEAGRIVGAVMAGYEGHRGWIQYLAVLPEFQGSGIGAGLVSEGVVLLRRRGCPKVNLQVRRSNLGVIRFYEKLGFVEDDVASMGLRLIDEEQP
jgi:ribosomal protein S18 acetylase RimI-like enzyme